MIRPMGLSSARRLGAATGSVFLALALPVSCGGSTSVSGTVTVHKQAAHTSHLSGSWTPPTPSTAAPTSAPPPTDPPAGTDPPVTVPPPAAVAVDDSPASQHDMDASAGLTVSPPWPHPWPTSFEVGDAVPPKVPLFSEPGVQVPGNRALSNPTWEGVQLVFLVRQDLGDWLQVQIQSRPNGAIAWIRPPMCGSEASRTT